MADYDVIVIGGGTVGISIAYGLVKLGQKTIVFDEGDVAFRAARGNFGLIWVQGKGVGCPEYANWTRHSADNWAQFNIELKDDSNIDIEYNRSGGFHWCFSGEELEERDKKMSRLVTDSNGEFQYTMLEHESLKKQLPEIGSAVKGASFCPQDGHVNPLLLLRSLHAAFNAKGGTLKTAKISNIKCLKNSFEVTTTTDITSAKKIVLAAGLGNLILAPKVGLNVPVRPQRGQILVTEKLKPFLKYPTSLIRQTNEGGVLLGDSHEEVGFNDGTSSKVMQDIAHQARCIFPHLNQARIVRAWGALRILTPDGLPIYDQSTNHTGAFVASSHSGITLAAAHALDFARYVVAGELPASLEAMSERRFHVH